MSALRVELEGAGQVVPDWCAKVRVVIIKTACPLQERREISGVLNEIAGLHRRCSISELCSLFTDEMNIWMDEERRHSDRADRQYSDIPNSHIHDMWLRATKKAGLRQYLKDEYMRKSKNSETLRKKSEDDLVCYHSLGLYCR